MRVSSKVLAEIQHLMRSPAGAQPKTGNGYKRGSGPNATEQRYYDEHIFPRLITGEYIWAIFEGIRFRVGKGNAFYCPDWAIMTKDGKLELCETKGGFSREASIVRIKAAAQQYPLTFRLCKYIGGEWQITTI